MADGVDRDRNASRDGKAGQPYFPFAGAAGPNRVRKIGAQPPLTPAPPLKPVGDVYFSSWADRFPVPSAVLGEDLQLLWSNAAADALFAAGKDFLLVNDIVGCVDKAQGQEFRAFLASIGDVPEAWIYCRDDTARQMVRAEAVRPDGLPPGIALMIYPIDGLNRFLWSDFHKVFGLTRAETVVVKRIMGGESADAIAEELSVALDTVRTHVRRVYIKLGVNNREQLFSKVSAFRIP
jgi:DNA-binding CsgD family transcriptional regulator